MKLRAEPVYDDLVKFIGGATTGLLQLLVAAAQKSTFQRIISCPVYPVPAKSSGLSSAVKQFLELKYCTQIHLPSLLAQLYLSVCQLKERKRTGQFFTAKTVADWAISKVLLEFDDNICDAGAGTGMFAHSIFRCGRSVRSYVGVENDPILALCAAHVLEGICAPESYKIWYANFLLLKKSDFPERGLAVPSVVISNPPFVRSRNLAGRARISASLKSSLGLRVSPYAGSGSYFMARAAELAGVPHSGGTSNSRLLFFLPAEAAGAAHVRQLLNDLQQSHRWNCRQCEIPNEQTGVDRHPSNALALLFLFEQGTARKIRRSQNASARQCLLDVVRIKRGISTGCNEFFVLTDEEVRRRKIPKRRLREVLPTRISIATDAFSKADWDQLRVSNRPCWLLALPPWELDDFEPAIREYLKEGLQQGVHETPTARTYPAWFSIPIPPHAPDIFVTYLFRGVPRFVLNEARVLHLTNILGGRFVCQIEEPSRRRMIVDSLNQYAKHWMKQNMAGRQYKGGLMKIEPGELSRLPVKPSLLKLFNRTKPRAIARSLFD